MSENQSRITHEQFSRMIDMLNPCMNDYLYILDLETDYYCISASVLERFRMESNRFYHTKDAAQSFVHPEDLDALCQDIEDIKTGKKQFHDMQYRWLDKEGSAVWINCKGCLMEGESGKPEYMVGCINEIGRVRKADNVSGLLNDTELRKELEARELTGLHGFLMRIGIDNFKEINEAQGMEYGDMVLRRTAECISKVTKADQKLYKIVADEFVVADFNGRDASKAVDLYEGIQRELGRFIQENGYEVVYTVSAGILRFSDVREYDYTSLSKFSEFALNEAKSGGKNKYYIYDEQDYQAFLKRMQLIRVLRHSVNNGFAGFELHYQPVVDIKHKCLSGAEALLRFRSAATGVVPPIEFIPLLEESGLIIPVGKWVLNTAMEACKKIQEQVPDFRISVNLSYIQVLKSNVLGEILSGVLQYGLKPGSIMIELTESGFLEANENFLNFCEGLRRYGIPLALDDFGTGYSNFRYLYNLNPHTLKIDRSFTVKALQSDYEYNLLQHMADMTRSIHTKFCIEGIETSQELNKICGIGPDYIQGYYFGKPCPYEEFTQKYIENPLFIEEVG